MADIDKLKRASYMSKRMVILKDSCETLGIRLEYLLACLITIMKRIKEDGSGKS